MNNDSSLLDNDEPKADCTSIVNFENSKNALQNNVSEIINNDVEIFKKGEKIAEIEEFLSQVKKENSLLIAETLDPTLLSSIGPSVVLIDHEIPIFTNNESKNILRTDEPQLSIESNNTNFKSRNAELNQLNGVSPNDDEKALDKSQMKKSETFGSAPKENRNSIEKDAEQSSTNQIISVMKTIPEHFFNQIGNLAWGIFGPSNIVDEVVQETLSQNIGVDSSVINQNDGELDNSKVIDNVPNIQEKKEQNIVTQFQNVETNLKDILKNDDSDDSEDESNSEEFCTVREEIVQSGEKREDQKISDSSERKKNDVDLDTIFDKALENLATNAVLILSPVHLEGNDNENLVHVATKTTSVDSKSDIADVLFENSTILLKSSSESPEVIGGVTTSSDFALNDTRIETTHRNTDDTNITLSKEISDDCNDNSLADVKSLNSDESIIYSDRSNVSCISQNIENIKITDASTANHSHYDLVDYESENVIEIKITEAPMITVQDPAPRLVSNNKDIKPKIVKDKKGMSLKSVKMKTIIQNKAPSNAKKKLEVPKKNNIVTKFTSPQKVTRSQKVTKDLHKNTNHPKMLKTNSNNTFKEPLKTVAKKSIDISLAKKNLSTQSKIAQVNSRFSSKPSALSSSKKNQTSDNQDKCGNKNKPKKCSSPSKIPVFKGLREPTASLTNKKSILSKTSKLSVNELKDKQLLKGKPNVGKVNYALLKKPIPNRKKLVEAGTKLTNLVKKNIDAVETVEKVETLMNTVEMKESLELKDLSVEPIKICGECKDGQYTEKDNECRKDDKQTVDDNIEIFPEKNEVDICMDSEITCENDDNSFPCKDLKTKEVKDTPKKEINDSNHCVQSMTIRSASLTITIPSEDVARDAPNERPEMCDEYDKEMLQEIEKDIYHAEKVLVEECEDDSSEDEESYSDNEVSENENDYSIEQEENEDEIKEDEFSSEEESISDESDCGSLCNEEMNEELSDVESLSDILSEREKSESCDLDDEITDVEQMLEKTLDRIKAELSGYRTSEDDVSESCPKHEGDKIEANQEVDQKNESITKDDLTAEATIDDSNKNENNTTDEKSVVKQEHKKRFSIVAACIEQFEKEFEARNNESSNMLRKKNTINKSSEPNKKEDSPTAEREVSNHILPRAEY